MKAIAPVRPQKDSGSSGNNSSSSSNTNSSSSSSDLSLHCLSDHSLHIARCRMEEEDLYNGAPYGDMNDCYSRLKRLVPTIPQDKKVSKVEILQHVIDYILDLQLALETHPSLSKQPQQQQQQQQQRTSGANNPTRTPLTVLNIDHQRTSIVKKPEDSILCR